MPKQGGKGCPPAGLAEPNRGREELTKKGATVLRPFGNRTPGNNRYRCFLSDLAGLAARPPSGSRNSLSERQYRRWPFFCQQAAGMSVMPRLF